MSVSKFPYQIQALLLTGGRIKGVPESEPHIPGKGYIDINGRPMASYTLEALNLAKRISSVTMVTPLHPNIDLEVWKGVDNTALAGESLSSSLFSGLEAIGPISDPVLIVAGDLPFLTPEAIDDFVERCSKFPEASVWYGFLSQKDSQAKYPDLHHTWARLDGQKFCGTGLTGMRPNIVNKIKESIADLTSGRKSVIKLAKILGISTLLRLIFGRLKITQAEEAMSRLLNAPTRGIASPFAEVAFNVDEYDNLVMARSMMAKLGNSFSK